MEGLGGGVVHHLAVPLGVHRVVGFGLVRVLQHPGIIKRVTELVNYSVPNDGAPAASVFGYGFPLIHWRKLTERETKRERENSTTLFYKDCSLGSVKT